jgi:hypothetical protein
MRLVLDPRWDNPGIRKETPVTDVMLESTLDETTADEAPPLCETAECTCPDFCERDHDLD